MNISFNRRTDLALAALRTLATVRGRMRGSTLAEAIGTTASFLPQVMAPLVQGRWVVSGRRPGGGYELTDLAFDARLLDVVEATEGPAESGHCVLRDAPCPGEETCAVHEVWTRARGVLVDGFDAIQVLPTQRRRP